MSTEKRKLKIGLDFHGVISSDVLFFRDFTNNAIYRGHEIHIITGGPENYIRNFLDREAIKFTTIFAIMDYYKAKGEGKYLEGEFYVHEEIWDTAKSKYYEDNCINFHIDDKSDFKTDNMTFCQYDEKARNCTLNSGTVIELSGDAVKALNAIEAYVEANLPTPNQ